MKKILILLFSLSLTSAITFDCCFNDGSFTHFPSIYMCAVVNYNEENNEVLTKVIGNTESSRSYSDVDGIYLNLEGKNLRYIPKGLEKFFPHLKAIFIYFGNITKLNGDELREYKELEWFAIEFNPLMEVPRNFFANNPKMKNIFFDNNKITQVSLDFFDQLQNLEKVYFSNNTCTNFDAESPSDFEMLKSDLISNCKEVEPTTKNSLARKLETATEENELEVYESSKAEIKLSLCEGLVDQKIEKLSLEIQEIKKMLKNILEKLNSN